MAAENFLGVRLTPREAAILDDLTQRTGRDRSNLARALILLAGNDPHTQQRLGDLSDKTQPLAGGKPV